MMTERGLAWRRLGAAFALVSGLGFATGCHKDPVVEFNRPPASASVPETPPEVVEVELPDQTAEVEKDPEKEPEEPVAETQPAPRPARPAPTPPPDPEPTPPPRPQLPAGSQPDAEQAQNIAVKLQRTTDLFDVLRERRLTVEQREQVEAAQAFVVQARSALDEGDVVRAAVLGDKGYLLAEDVERASR